MNSEEKKEFYRVQAAIYKPNVELINKTVCDYLAIDPVMIKEHYRSRTATRARHYVFYFVKKIIPHCPHITLGILCGNGKAFNHSTVSHALGVIEDNFTLNHRGQPFNQQTVIDLAEIQERLNKVFAERKELKAKRCSCCGSFIFLP